MPKHWLTILITIFTLFVIELALNIRSHIRYGQSVFNLASKETTYTFDRALGLKVLRKSAVISGTQAVIKTNSLGLRSPEIALVKAPGVFRIGVVGASSVMGTYTKENGDTLAYKLQELADESYGEGTIELINAGIAGYSLNDQRQMIEKLLLPLDIDGILLYPGFNDLGGYCRTKENSQSEDFSLVDFAAPNWLLSVELVTKNTVFLRHVEAEKETILQPEELDTSTYEDSLNTLFRMIRDTGLPILVVTNPRAYSRTMPDEEQQDLSSTARYYNPCFSIDGLHDLYDSHNDMIVHAAEQQGFSIFRLDHEMPSGAKYFGDASHFSIHGTEFAAGLIFPHLVDSLGLKHLENQDSLEAAF